MGSEFLQNAPATRQTATPIKDLAALLGSLTNCIIPVISPGIILGLLIACINNLRVVFTTEEANRVWLYYLLSSGFIVLCSILLVVYLRWWDRLRMCHEELKAGLVSVVKGTAVQGPSFQHCLRNAQETVRGYIVVSRRGPLLVTTVLCFYLARDLPAMPLDPTLTSNADLALFIVHAMVVACAIELPAIWSRYRLKQTRLHLDDRMNGTNHPRPTPGFPRTRTSTLK